MYWVYKISNQDTGVIGICVCIIKCTIIPLTTAELGTTGPVPGRRTFLRTPPSPDKSSMRRAIRLNGVCQNRQTMYSNFNLHVLQSKHPGWCILTEFHTVLDIQAFNNETTHEIHQSCTQIPTLETKKREISPRLNVIITNVWGAGQMKN